MEMQFTSDPRQELCRYIPGNKEGIQPPSPVHTFVKETFAPFLSLGHCPLGSKGAPVYVKYMGIGHVQ